MRMHEHPTINYPEYHWPAGKRCAVVFSLDLDAESPFLWLHRGQQVQQLGEIEQRRFGPRQGLARVVRLFAEYGIRGSFYVPGVVAQTYPGLLPFLLEGGHEIAHHGYYHERIEAIPVAQAEDYLVMAQELFCTQTGLSGLGHRAPSWEMTSDFLQALERRGVSYDSSLMGFDHPYHVGNMVEVPVQWTVDDALYFRYTNSPRDKTHPANPGAVLDSWIEEFEGVRETGGLFMVTLHDWISGRSQRLRLLRKLIAHIRHDPQVWWARADEVAAWHAASPNRDLYRVPAHSINTHFESASRG
ncbi:polysaccharide deacetylase [Verminephrobacter aporrectodeae subsp. tuberculatae]|uniref:polysaccharide deacetylase family protein n=1 Tax=Verminephrobacter aporrectodeae TaxID=1110389 RepID=UPI00224474B1|nr:polysaccharide deacetylase [Verminephrobacter aporrectodeae]MCW8163662.1 polysaccharide deacetylase [Verminephrobacter aporrectodeae subsp. tuberculatae]MCW8168468.1 polysaccharide deacetylase [Verminephrobacter aporrectodeae subsp. tuberculatae]MCW8206920.1 polysaccharide deacetylase [Verminephrobacter aporrectodeae subsp. tuberculatae]